MERAIAFYEGTLGLVSVRAGVDGSRIYAAAGETALMVYPSPEHAGRATATMATWYVDDVEAMVDELTARGVTFVHYEGVVADGFDYSTNEKGIAPRAGGGRIAWFQDPDGNTFAVEGDR
jgi:catechol 2,3-dioxygenase-like lactoylglutathione lyase family enzyme